MSNKTQKPPQKLRRNERERKRVNQVNQGFNSLRDRVPRPAGTKHKLSKVETLREAARYIAHLRTLLGGGGEDLVPAATPSPSYYQPQHHHSAYYQPQQMDYQPAQVSPSNSFYSDSSYEEMKYYPH